MPGAPSRAVRVVWCLALVHAVLAANECRVTVQASQDVYDLTPLSSPTDYDVDDLHGGTIKLNICQSVKTEVYGIPDPASVGIYRETEGGPGQSLGGVHDDPVVLPPPKGDPGAQALSITYPAGSVCPAGGSFSSVLILQCDQSVYGTGHPILAGVSDGGCAHFFLWRTGVACANPPSRGIGAALLVFLAVGLIACIVFYGSSVVYNRLVLHKRGTEAFPSLSGVIASVRGAVNGVRDLVGRLRGRPRGFRGLDEYEEETGLFDDDDDET